MRFNFTFSLRELIYAAILAAGFMYLWHTEQQTRHGVEQMWGQIRDAFSQMQR